MRPTRRALTLVALVAALACLFGRPALSAPPASKAHALPSGAVEATSTVLNVAGFMVSMDEGGRIPSEPAATCDNRADGNSAGNAGVHLEHYFPDAKDTFDQKVGVLRQYMGLKQGVQGEAGSAAVVSETLDGAEAAYFVAAGPCVEDVHPRATRVSYHVRLIRDATYADIAVAMFAASPDRARKYAQEILQKVKVLDFASLE